MRVLSFQRDFACRQSGACCAAGWHIPLDEVTRDRVAAAIRDGRLATPERGGAWMDASAPPAGAVAVLRQHTDGPCVFLERGRPNRCAIQHALGHAALPPACQQFPRVTLIDARGAHVTLSHFCPTVAGMLTRRDQTGIDIVDLPAPAPEERRIEGFDASDTVPPFLRPGVVFDDPSYAAWEQAIVTAFGRADAGSDAVLAAYTVAAEDLREWTPARGPLVADVGRVVAEADHRLTTTSVIEDTGATARLLEDVAASLFEDVAASVPEGLARPAVPGGFAAQDAAFVAHAWESLSLSIGRYLAAKAFAAQAAYLGEGLRTLMAAVGAARAVLRVEAARQAARAGHACDEGLLVEAARASDVLIEHQSDRRALVRRWHALERLPREAFLRRVGVAPGSYS